MGQQNLDQVYQRYDAYVAGSTSEGFGLTLMEAVGSGLPMVGFDVRYGNQTFIDDGQNGYRLSIDDGMTGREKIKLLSEGIVRLFTDSDMEAFREHSYEKGKEYLTSEVEKKWAKLLNRI
jgi:glycosyltransferase involved in cell wall biosynthesis